MSNTAIDFPANRSQLDPSLNSPPFTDIPLENGDTFIASGSSYTWAQDAGDAYGRWKNEDPGATSDARYVKKEDEGKTQVINGGGTLSINDNILLNGSDGSATFAGTVTSANSFAIQTEADDDTKYTSTTDVDEEGNETVTRVYNGEVLDVKDRLTKADNALKALKTAAAAAADFASLQSAIATALADI